MAKILSQDEIDALLSSVSGDATELSESDIKQKITIYDFKHPNLVSKEQLRLLETIHEGLCRNFGVFLSASLRMIVEMNMLAVDQIMYSEFVMSIAPPSCIYVCDIDTPKSKVVLELNPQLAILIVERLFGGRGGFVSDLRPISVIEQKVMQRVVERIAVELSKNWGSIAQFNTTIEKFESNPEFVQVVASSEPVVVISMEVKIHGNSTLLNICYPYMWISNVVSTPEVQERILFGARDTSEEEKNIIKSSLKETNVELRSVLGKSKITVDDFVNLREGDVLKLNTRIDSNLPLYVENLQISDTSIGIRRKKYACRLTSELCEEIRDE